MHYTLLPGRIIGGDNYNPFTNTINLYSDHAAVALHEGGHAKDFASRKYKGTYAVVTALPGLSLWPEAIATNDALGYLRVQENYDGEQEAYRVLYPAYATYVAGAASPLLPYGDLVIKAGAVIPGHLLGRWKANSVKQEQIAKLSRSKFQQVSVSDHDALQHGLPGENESVIEQIDHEAETQKHTLNRPEDF